MSEGKSGNFVVDILEWLKANPGWVWPICATAAAAGGALLGWNHRDPEVLKGFPEAYTVTCAWTAFWAALACVFIFFRVHVAFKSHALPGTGRDPLAVARQREANSAEPSEAEKVRILGEFSFLEKPLRTVLVVLMLQDRRTFHGPCGDVYLQTLRNRGFIRLVPGKWQYHDYLHEIPDFVWSFLQSKRKELGAEPNDRSVDPRNPWNSLPRR